MLNERDHDGAALVVRDGGALRGQGFAFLNGTFLLKVSGRDTGGGLCIYDTHRHEIGGPPLHVHHHQDEWFMVIDGAFDFSIGTETHQLGPGDSILGPRGVPHAFCSRTPTARMMIAFQPAGSMEAFFNEGSTIDPLTPVAFAELSARHGMTVVGPPLRR